jgi:hypothetical protein
MVPKLDLKLQPHEADLMGVTESTGFGFASVEVKDEEAGKPGGER